MKFKLELCKRAVYAIFIFHELSMGALFDDGSLVQHIDAIHFPDGGEAMRNDDGSSVLHQFIQGILHLFFRFGIE